MNNRGGSRPGSKGRDDEARQEHMAVGTEDGMIHRFSAAKTFRT